MQDVHVILGAPQTEKIKPLIQAKGLVIGVDRGALIAIEEKIQLDVALGDFDSISKEDTLRVKQHAGKIISHPIKKDDTDAELALFYVLNNLEANDIYIYNWSGGRVDHLYSLLMIVLQERFLKIVPKIKFVSENNFIAYYLAGDYTITKSEGMEYLSFILLTPVRELTLRNVTYPLQKVDFNQPQALISNAFLNKTATFSFTEGIVGVIQSRDANELSNTR